MFRSVVPICLVVLSVVLAEHFVPTSKHACGICKEIRAGHDCSAFNACGMVEASVRVGCYDVCGTAAPETASPTSLAAAPLDVRITKGFGTRSYDQIRVSLVTSSADPPVADFFDYSARFQYKWTDNFLHTALKTVVPGQAAVYDVGTAVTVKLPEQGAGVAGVLIADPCVDSGLLGWVGCEFGAKFQTSNRTPELINAFAGDGSTDFWGIFGDNFYDRTGDITKGVFSKISLAAKSKLFVSVAGNHDYWVLGSPDASSAADQCGNGYMQFYAQDTKAAENISQGSATAPFDFSVDPVKGLLGCRIPALANFFWYNQIGNVGLVGQSGAYTLEEAKPFMTEACEWLSKQQGLDVALLVGHWDIGGLGADADMAMPQWYTEMAALPGCSEFDQRGMLKFVMGHTHCNDPHPHGKVGAGFRVAGFGMEGCGNYGIPIVDTTQGRVRFWYFDTSTDAAYDSVLGCVQQKGWRNCTDQAVLWLDQPYAVRKAEKVLFM